MFCEDFRAWKVSKIVSQRPYKAPVKSHHKSLSISRQFIVNVQTVQIGSGVKIFVSTQATLYSLQ